LKIVGLVWLTELGSFQTRTPGAIELHAPGCPIAWNVMSARFVTTNVPPDIVIANRIWFGEKLRMHAPLVP